MTRIRTISNLNHSNPTPYEKVMVFGSWEKLGENHRRDFTFFFLRENGGNWRVLKTFEGGAKLSNFLWDFWPVHVWPACATRGQRGALAVWHKWYTRGHSKLGLLAEQPLAHLSRSSAVFGHPNSEFESVFRLRTLTPSRTTKTMKLWKMVENSSRKMTTNTTQRMRTKSSVATSFGLET